MGGKGVGAASKRRDSSPKKGSGSYEQASSSKGIKGPEISVLVKKSCLGRGGEDF